MKLKHFLVKGERCSGTNYLEKLIEENLGVPLLNPPDWKHGYVALSVTDNFIKPKTDYLTIFIFRNVFDWARSFYIMPHHLPGSKSGHWEVQPTFEKFIRQEVRMIDANNEERNMDRHPYTFEHPKNIFELRKWKTQNWLSYSKLNKPAYYVKYEDLLINPERIIREINDQWFGIDFTFNNWDFYQRNEEKKYQPKEYFKIGNHDFHYFVKNVDWSLEKKIGYNLRNYIENKHIYVD